MSNTVLVILSDEWERVSNNVIYSTGGKRKLRAAMTEVDLDDLIATKGHEPYTYAEERFGYERACKDILAHIKEG